MPSYEASAAGYKAMWAEAKLTRRSAALAAAKRALAQWDHYARGAERLGHSEIAPLIAAIHYREADLDLHGCLANGDLAVGTGHKTTHVPAGLGPYATFEDSCYDAWRHEGFLGIKDWPISRWLWAAEKFNGWGYVTRGINAPYDWAGTSLEQAGKFVADREFDSTVRDKQLGVVAVLKALFELKPDLEPRSAPVATPAVVVAAGGAATAIGMLSSGGHEWFALGIATGVVYLIATWLWQNHQEKPMFALTNWRTTLLGVGALLSAAGPAVTSVASGHVPDPNTIGLVFAGILGIFAKDSNVTGGTKQQ